MNLEKIFQLKILTYDELVYGIITLLFAVVTYLIDPFLFFLFQLRSENSLDERVKIRSALRKIREQTPNSNTSKPWLYHM